MTSKRRDFVVMDTCALLYLFMGQDEEKASAVQYVMSQHGREFDVLIPTVVLLELCGKVKDGNSSTAQRQARLREALDALNGVGYLPVELDESTVRLGVEYTAEHNLQGIDASILATAVRNGAKSLYTYDRGLLKVDSSVTGVTVLEPPLDPAPTLSYPS